MCVNVNLPICMAMQIGMRAGSNICTMDFVIMVLFYNIVYYIIVKYTEV